MKPSSPVLPGYQISEHVYTSPDPNTIPLPAVLANGGTQVLSRWELTLEDRQRIADGQDVYVWVHTFGNKLQPIWVEVVKPEEIMNRGGKEYKCEDPVEAEWPDVIGEG